MADAASKVCTDPFCTEDHRDARLWFGCREHPDLPGMFFRLDRKVVCSCISDRHGTLASSFVYSADANVRLVNSRWTGKSCDVLRANCHPGHAMRSYFRVGNPTRVAIVCSKCDLLVAEVML